ncbi:MAG: AEC family transporter [Treponemataceae bacterium]
MKNFELAFIVIFPLFINIFLGYMLRQFKIINENFASQLNKLIFQVLFPVLIFSNIIHTQIDDYSSLYLAFHILTLLIALSIITIGVIMLLERDNKRRGVLMQAIIRSNFILYGMTIPASIYTNEDLGFISILVAIIIPAFNILSVIILEVFCAGRIHFKKILLGIITNPLIIASLIGIVCLQGQLKLPPLLDKWIISIAGLSTTLAFISLGASLNFSASKKIIQQLIIGSAGKLIFAPLFAVIISILMGFRQIELIVIFSTFAPPTAIASFPMAVQMGGDKELAGQLVVVTAFFSLFTIFFGIVLLQAFHLL